MLGTIGVQAAEISLEQKQALIERVEELNQRFDSGEITALVEAMPPRLYAEMAARLHQNIVDLRADFSRRLAQQFETNGLKDYHFDTDNIAYHETKNGGLYALVPTRMEMQDTIHNMQTLAIYEEGWYFIQGGQKTVQNPVFLEIYPFLAEIIIPPAQITKIENQK